MRVDLTLCDLSGTSRDIAVSARGEASFADLRRALPDVLAGDVWAGDRRVVDEEALGSSTLSTGTVLTVGGPGIRDLAAGAMLRAQVVGGADAGRSHALSSGVVTLGRAPECDVVLPDPDVSRRHAQLDVSSHGVSIRDLGSTNGTCIDGEPVGTSCTPLPPGALVRMGDSFLTLAAAAEPPAAVRPGADGGRLVNRAPRLHARPQAAELVMPEKAQSSRPQRVQWLGTLLPACLGAALAVTMHSLQFLAFVLLSPVIALATALGDRIHWRRDRRRAVGSFRRRAAAAQQAIAAGLAEEASTRRLLYPDPATVLDVATRPGARLWERDIDAADALTVRLGLGRQPSWLRARTGAVVAAAGVLDDVPLVADLRDGPLGVAAPLGRGTAIARWIVGQLATLHSPTDLEIALLLSDSATSDWTWTRWLPHVRGRVATTPAERSSLVAEVAELAARRTAERSSRAHHVPWLVVVVDRAAEVVETPGLADVLTAGPAARISAICLDSQPHRLPASCAAVAQSCGETATRLRLRTPAQRDTSATSEFDVAVADGVSHAWAERLARALAPLADAAAGSDSVPDSCRLVDLLGLTEPDPSSVLARWSASDGAATTVLGLGHDGPVRVDLDRDGPHALVAGTTGAGKSELLQSFIAGLAATYPPDEMSFVLVDYKGGAAFGECARLPHTTGVVTDLDAHLTARALRSLDAELRRRESLFAVAGASDLRQYRSSGAPLAVPRLVLVVDEFAALADELPEFVGGMVSLAQRGRSLGMHLVLATQRPSGVVSPEIRANTSLRIALRVTDAAESTDVVGCDAAADLDRRRPGRAVLRIGSTLTHLQVARVAGPAAIGATPAGVRVEPLDDWRRRAACDTALEGDKTDLRLLTDCIREAATRAGLSTPRPPWLPALPAHLSVTELEPVPSETSVHIGMVDLPAQQAQVPFTVDLAAGSSLLLVGGARSGRTTALSTIALQAATQLPPERLHLHAIDFGGGLDPLTALPHCGTVIRRDDAELVSTLLTRLAEEVARRQRVLAAHRAATIAESWAAGGSLPVVVLLVDSWDALQAASDEQDLGRGAQQLIDLLRDAPSVGITVVVAGDRGALAPRLGGAVTSRLVLRLADPADAALAGITPSALPRVMPPGRAVRTDDGAEVQLAHPGRAPTRDEQRRVAAEVSGLWGNLDSRPGHIEQTPPIRVRPLPSRVELTDLGGPPGRVVLGVGGDAAEVVTIDPFAGAARLLVAGPARSGRTTVLRSVLRQVVRADQPVVVAAAHRSPLCAEAHALGVPVLPPDAPADTAIAAGARTLLLVDDSELFLDTPVGDSLDALARANSDLAVMVAGRTEDILLAFRGLAAHVRRARCCLILQPGAGDGELVGQRLPRQRAAGIPGRGLMVGDPAWGPLFDASAVPIQVAQP